MLCKSKDNGVNAHQQNGKAEKQIRDLQIQGRTMLIHAIHQWKDDVVPQLWSYATRLANEIINSIPRPKDGEIRLPLFAYSNNPSRLDTLLPLGVLSKVLEKTLQQGNKIGKWEIGAELECIWGLPVHMLDLNILYCQS